MILHDSEPECPSHSDQQRFRSPRRWRGPAEHSDTALWWFPRSTTAGRVPPRPAYLRDSFLWMHPLRPAWFKESLLWCKKSPLLMHKLSQMEHKAVASDFRFSPGSSEAADGGLLPLPKSRVMYCAATRNSQGSGMC